MNQKSSGLGFGRATKQLIDKLSFILVREITLIFFRNIKNFYGFNELSYAFVQLFNKYFLNLLHSKLITE